MVVLLLSPGVVVSVVVVDSDDFELSGVLAVVDDLWVACLASEGVPSEWTMMGTSSSSDFASAVLLFDCWVLCWEGMRGGEGTSDEMIVRL